ncbi:MAG: hypothetical protein K0S65_689 [Labilithrix sp.]|nr:hypothetical protein [Labilithrix sp.]
MLRAGNKPGNLRVGRLVDVAFGRSLLAWSLLCTLAACDRKASNGEPSETRPQASAAASGVPVASAPLPEPKTEKVEVPEVRVRTNADTTVRVSWVTPQGTAVNDDAPFRVRWNRSDGLVDAPNDVKSTGSAVKDGFRVKVRPMTGAPNATLGGEINIVVCDSLTHSVCVPVRRSLELGFVVTKDAAEEATVAIPLPAAK